MQAVFAAIVCKSLR